MIVRQFTPAQQAEALNEGASALRYRAERVLQHSDATAADKGMAQVWRTWADVLDAMASKIDDGKVR